jgi:hypothetical protein
VTATDWPPFWIIFNIVFDQTVMVHVKLLSRQSLEVRSYYTVTLHSLVSLMTSDCSIKGSQYFYSHWTLCHLVPNTNISNTESKYPYCLWANALFICLWPLMANELRCLLIPPGHKCASIAEASREQHSMLICFLWQWQSQSKGHSKWWYTFIT